MTWHTSSGDRVLEDDEKYVFVHALHSLFEFYRHEKSPGDEYVFYRLLKNRAFENLIDSKKAALFWKVAHYLLEDTDGLPEATSFDECAVFYIYKYFYTCELENRLTNYEETGKDEVLSIILSYAKEQEAEQELLNFFPSGLHDRDRTRWYEAINLMSEKILWDQDFEEFADDEEEYCEDPKFPASIAIDHCFKYLTKKKEELEAILFGKDSSSSFAEAPAAEQEKKKRGKKQTASTTAESEASTTTDNTTITVGNTKKKRRSSAKKIVEKFGDAFDEVRPKKKTRNSNKF